MLSLGSHIDLLLTWIVQWVIQLIHQRTVGPVGIALVKSLTCEESLQRCIFIMSALCTKDKLKEQGVKACEHSGMRV